MQRSAYILQFKNNIFLPIKNPFKFWTWPHRVQITRGLVFLRVERLVLHFGAHSRNTSSVRRKKMIEPQNPPQSFEFLT